ncbi:MAG: peroxiredoxin [Candidatus Aenigmarchaeota archaeon]|nr:peroxiredoxin [Candidatus Aenigmarchaeota archaeon]
MLMLNVGDGAPDVEIEDHLGKKTKMSDFRGKTVVLYFYPRDNTPGCTTEACSFRDELAGIKKLGAEIVGVSTDSAQSHQGFIKKYGLNFTLLADKSREFSKAYGVLKFTGTAARATYIIGKDGRITHVFPKVSPSTHTKEIIAALKEY